MLGRRLIVGLFIVLLGLGFMHVSRQLVQPVLGTDVVPPIIRLHVIPHSDSVKDQDAKLLVRDDVLSYLQQAEILASQTTVEGAVTALEELLPGLQRVASGRLAELGMRYDVVVDLSVVTYGPRPSMADPLPPGDYLSLQVIIGAGKGSNFWCIVFPGLCFVPEPTLVHPPGASPGNIAHAASPPASETEAAEGAGLFKETDRYEAAGTATNTAATEEHAGFNSDVGPRPTDEAPGLTAKFQWRWAWLDRLFGN